ncbi:MAG: BamA/TamA family outer membrane protein [Rhodobacteraceae bacterium]|nr:BamA/TamA family outer membrane protein [Paracoccaceae bacterium]
MREGAQVWNAARARLGALTLALALSAAPAHALDRLVFAAPGADKDLLDRLRSASLLVSAERDKTTDSQTVFASARADYGRLLGALYAAGYYSGVVHIDIDGREAAGIAPLDAPGTIGEVRVKVEPGPLFHFAKARMKPYARGTKLPPDYRDTRPAYSTAIVDAAEAGVAGWRAIGHAKAAVSGQSVVADHRSATIASEIELAPGPRVRFGALHVSGYERMRLQRILKIAGYPEGEVFDPEMLDKVAARLRRTGVFRTVAVTEAETLGPTGTLDIDLVLAEEKKRRFGVGAEVSTTEGLNLNGYWMHRNLFGGAERLRVDAAAEQIGGASGDVAYSLGVRIDRPATPVTDATAFIETEVSREKVLDLTLDTFGFGFGLSRPFGDHFTAEAGISYVNETARFSGAKFSYEVLALPVALTWDRRDSALDAHDGFYLKADLTPFWGFGTSDSGGQIKADARIYRSFGQDDRFVLAGRAQLGTVAGGTLLGTPPSYLFWSGGGGTVRGQPYQSLGVSFARQPGLTYQTGGLSFAALSGELRAQITEKIGAVAFYDAGYISTGDFFGGIGEWHSGAGVGMRYNTGIGPIRVDVGLPVSGRTGDGVQFYVGIGQAF